MPPRGALTSTAVIDSSDEEAAAAHPKAARERTTHKAPFNKMHILQTVLGVPTHDSVAAHFHHSGTLSSQHVREQWKAWYSSTPHNLGELAPEEQQLPMKMPAKCQPSGQGRAATASAPNHEPELIAYTNRGDGARKFTKEMRDRNEAAGRASALTVADLPLGSFVGVARSPEDPLEPPGYGTPFYAGQVVRVMTDNDGGADSTSAAPGLPRMIDVHYTMPTHRGRFCDDISKPYSLACVAMHPWTQSCERTCAQHRPEGATTSRFMATIDVHTIFETKLQFTNGGHCFDAHTKKRLAETNPEWGKALKLRKK